jgi:hypothetical protein
VADGAPVLDRKVVLTQCRTAADKHLCTQLERLLEAVGRRLEELAREAKDNDERAQHLRAVNQLNSNRPAFFNAFRKELAERFEERARALAGTGLFPQELGREELAMLKTNVVENEAAIGRLGIVLKDHASAELAELSGRCATMFRHAAVNDGDNPIGPTTIARGVFAGFAALQFEGRSLRATRVELERQLAEPVRELYRGLNGALAGLGIAPAVARSAGAASAAAGKGPVASAGSPAASTPGTGGAGADTGASWDGEVEAVSAVATALAGSSVPAAVESFLKETWLRVLARAYDAQGAQGAPWREAIGTMQDLVSSLKAQLEPAERARIVGLLPTILRRLTAGMDAVGLAPEPRKAFLDALMVRHRELLRPSAKAG